MIFWLWPCVWWNQLTAPRLSCVSERVSEPKTYGPGNRYSTLRPDEMLPSRIAATTTGRTSGMTRVIAHIGSRQRFAGFRRPSNASPASSATPM